MAVQHTPTVMSSGHDPLSPHRRAAQDSATSADKPDRGRRSAVILIGGCVVCVLGGSIPIDALTPAHATPSPSSTPIPCDCTTVSGSDLGIQTTDIALNSVVYVPGYRLFVCRDAAGYYVMTSVCPHAGCDLGQTSGVFTPTNLASGFHCTCHGSGFSGDGSVRNGPASISIPLQHYRLSVDATTKHLFIDLTPPFADITCRCPG